jgi:hypothetical protein
MKIEIEVKDELVKQFGEEAIRIYLSRKAEKLEELLNQNITEEEQQRSDSDSNADAIKNSWANFNKRGFAC